MATPYDYVQIVAGDDWGLVGIIPNNGAAASRAKNPFINTNQHVTGNLKPVPEATVVNRRRPIAHVMTKRVDDPPITRAESTNISSLDNNINLNALNGIGALESLSIVDNKTMRIDDSDLLLFGEISNLAGARNRANVLVGFGR